MSKLAALVLLLSAGTASAAGKTKVAVTDMNAAPPAAATAGTVTSG